MTHPTCDLSDNVPDELVPDPQVAREFNVTLMTLWRWDHDPKLAELGWEPPVKIRTRNYRRRRPLEFKVALRNFGITALSGSPRSNGARPDPTGLGPDGRAGCWSVRGARSPMQQFGVLRFT